MNINLKHHKNIVKTNIPTYNIQQVVWGTNTYYVTYTLHKRFRQTCYNSLAIVSNIQVKYVCFMLYYKIITGFGTECTWIEQSGNMTDRMHKHS